MPTGLYNQMQRNRLLIKNIYTNQTIGSKKVINLFAFDF